MARGRVLAVDGFPRDVAQSEIVARTPERAAARRRDCQ
ncbi:hypothetical protein FHR81_003646 [Actinoalloteichus hoggarensis]|nr:hypothetical protein [Actinoalloteichus hoggarensis]